MNDAATQPSGTLISNATILILSGFLIGISVAQPLGDFGFYVFACGSAGMIAYLALEVIGIRKNQVEVEEQQLVVDRLLKHVNSTSGHAAQ
ncbi:hypothetical protein SH668x_000010 [Planctomicrobium sp. SH668]|uniref:hypothetical protein n=1 Tax=Planctomicrobium sp. SH668 TaxID=3448126 RepID=UPI003F5C13E5